MKTDELIKDIQSFSNLRGISGSEYRIAKNIAAAFEPYADEVKTDTLGNVIAIKRCGRDAAKKVMIEAHMDEIGLTVTSIDDRGFLTFANVGGVDRRILPSMEVVVHGKRDVIGVIGAKPPHLREKGDTDKSTPLKDMAVDVGMTKEEAEAVISVGDSITLAQSSGELLGGNLSGKSLDDRASVAAVLNVMKAVANTRLNADIYAVSAVCEEIGGMGAETAAYAIEPDIAVAIDVCHGITPDNSYNAFENGCGAVISVGPNLHPKLTKRLFDTAEEYGIKTETDVDGGDTGTDAWVIQVSRAGVPTALLSIPLKYMHTSVETLAASDVKATAELLTRFIADLPETDEEWRDWLCF